MDFAFCDLAGGSNNDAVLATIGIRAERAVLDLILDRRSIRGRVTGDVFGGDVFKVDFEARGVRYVLCRFNAGELFDWLG